MRNDSPSKRATLLILGVVFVVLMFVSLVTGVYYVLGAETERPVLVPGLACNNSSHCDQAETAVCGEGTGPNHVQFSPEGGCVITCYRADGISETRTYRSRCIPTARGPMTAFAVVWCDTVPPGYVGACTERPVDDGPQRPDQEIVPPCGGLGLPPERP